MFVGPLPRELKPPGDRVPARRPRGRVSPRASLKPERRVPTRAPQAPTRPRTRALFAADTPCFATPFPSLRRPARCASPLAVPRLAAPSHSPRRPARYAIASRRAVPLVAVALLRAPLVGIAFLHAQGPHSMQYRRGNGTGVQYRRGNGTGMQCRRVIGAGVQKRRSNVTTDRPPMHMSRWRNGRHKNCALTWAVRSPLDSRQVFSTSPLLPCTKRTEETWAQNATSR